MNAPLLERMEVRTDSDRQAGISLAGANIGNLYHQLSTSAAGAESRESFQLEVLKTAIAITGAEAGVIVVRDSKGAPALGPRLYSESVTSQQSQIVAELKPLVTEVMSNPSALSVPAQAPSLAGMLFLVTPVSLAGSAREAFALVVAESRLPTDLMLSMVQLFAGFIDLYDTHRQARQGLWEADLSAGLIELVAKVSTIRDRREALHTLSCDLQSLIGCSHVAIASVDERDRVRRVEIVSGLSDHDGRSALARSMEDAMRAALETKKVQTLVADGPGGESDRVAQSNLHQMTGCRFSVAAPLQTLDGEVTGVVLCWWDKAVADPELNRRIVSASALPVAALFANLNQPRRFTGPRRAAGGQLNRWIRLLGIASVLAALIGSLFVPVQYRVAAGVVLEPTLSRIVTAPFDGILEQTTVKPGQVAEPDQLLATLDGDDLRIQLSDVEAEILAAEKRRDILLAEGQTHGAQIARLELDRLLIKKSLYAERLSNLEIRSPIAGLVVAGNLEKLVGSPLSRGDELFEIAPLEDMVAEIEVPAEDIADVEAGMPVRLQIEGLADSHWETALASLRPRAEIRDGRNVFVSETAVANTSQTLRPGMRGSARIDAGERPLGWVLFHQPAEKLQHWLGWTRGEAH